MQGLLEGNRHGARQPRRASRRRRPRRSSGRATSARDELAKVHLSNLPENLAFFSGAIDAAGSFGGIYQSAVLAYGSDLIKDPPDAERFAEPRRAARRSTSAGTFKEQKVAIAPIRIGGSGVARRQSAAVEGHPVPVRAELGDARPEQPGEPEQPRRDQEDAAGQPGFDASCCAATSTTPWSTNSASRAARAYVRSQALKAMELSQAARRQHQADADLESSPSTPQRIEVVGRGWEEPVGAELRREPPRRSAVVHDRVAAQPPTATANQETAMPVLYAQLQRRFGKPQDGLTRREMLQATLAAVGRPAPQLRRVLRPDQSRASAIVVVGAGFSRPRRRLRAEERRLRRAGLRGAQPRRRPRHHLPRLRPRQARRRRRRADRLEPPDLGRLRGALQALQFLDVTEDEDFDAPIVLGGKPLTARGIRASSGRRWTRRSTR